ncbi:homocysteine S-methyltransferase family protein [Pseudothermotoga thermarum]|uniref:Methionine synthase n=1 Tax=Pseudothermotoga thermarum DSM 5069 TaxID=688269 RepID=F7YXH9_9THEM|nr:homocysteine S-methyltransferase family protein [Pseudothermotoga thermarum]AEH50620.1 methionine synthase (B12-dependent) [Pseudothermotoga thermarum DSM 5069]
MKREEFHEMLKQRVLFLDGAYGTEFFKRGYKVDLIELLNVKNPQAVAQLQKEYVQAGADILLTNTFSANRAKLKAHGYEELFEKINVEAVKIAKSVANGRLVFGDISSTGSFVKPLGEMDFDEAYFIFKEQAQLLIESGVDGIIIETMSDLKELKAAILAVRDVSKDIPLIASMTFDANGKSVTGTSVEIFSTLMNDLDVDVASINCTLEPKDMLNVFIQLAKYCNKYLCVEPNAGKPILRGNVLEYKTTPDEFAIYMRDFVEFGANIVGGCCGTGPKHIKSMVEYIGNQKPKSKEPSKRQFVSSRTVMKPVEDFLIIGERINASGKKKLQVQIQQKDFSTIVQLAQEQEKEGCAVIDVNLGIEKLLEKDHFKQVIIELDRVSALPLSLDIQNLEFLETAAKEYVGRPMINSALAREDHLIERLKILKRYGGILIVLTMEKDIPKTPEERFKLALKAVEIIKKEGVDLDRIFFDPLVLPVGAGNDYRVTVKTIELLNSAGLKTCIGLSNLSFGMPEREKVNAAFLALCMEAGLKAAILNSKETTTMNIIEGMLLLKGKELAKTKVEFEDPLVEWIVKGQKDKVMDFVKEKLKDLDPLTVSQQILAKAMERVGKLYSEGVIFLPQLILAAETVQPVFEYLNSLLTDSKVKLGTVVLATVQGDIHDIGKKIVATVLRSGGFEVYDLGKDVPADKILESVKKIKPDIVGLSAMMTTTVGRVKEVADLLKENGVNVVVIAGGASMNKELAEKFGVLYAKDALEGLEVCKKIVEERRT